METIKTKDLRIGNLVDCFGTREVIEIKRHKIKVQHESSKGHFICEWVPIKSLSLKPITITKERLLKLGFENGNYQRLILKDAPIFFENHPYKNGELVLYVHNCANMNTQYVHDLQNVVFVLTGNELPTINLL